MGSQYCAQHLELLGIKVHMVYKYGGSSDVVDHVEKVTVLREFPKDSIILRLFFFTKTQALSYQKYRKNKCKYACGLMTETDTHTHASNDSYEHPHVNI